MAAAEFRSSVGETPFGEMPDGSPASLFTLRAEDGLRLTVTNYGGAIQSLWAPDREGKWADVVLGYGTLREYIGGKSFFGAMAGRYANRIANASFTLDGVDYPLAKNDGPNHLHGGAAGFNRRLWTPKIVEKNGLPSLVLSRLSPDGEEGYPGNLRAQVTYSLVAPNALQIRYHAETDRATPINLTNHSYFNLAGNPRRDVLSHELRIFADRITPVGGTLIPTGELRPVTGTPFDFNESRPIGERIDDRDEQLLFAGGYDHNFVIAGQASGNSNIAAKVFDPQSGRLLEVFTTEPGVQFYSGNFLDGSEMGKGGVPYLHRTGFCLETQHFPDSPNQSGFPCAILRPGETYASTTIYRFGAR